MNPELQKQVVLYGAIGLGVIIALHMAKKAVKGGINMIGDAASAVGQAINPVSDQNLIYSGVNSVGEAMSGEKGFSLGVWAYEVTHPQEEAKVTKPKGADTKKPPVIKSTQKGSGKAAAPSILLPSGGTAGGGGTFESMSSSTFDPYAGIF